MSAADPAVTLRGARDEDQAFFGGVYASAREQELAPLPWTPEQKAAFLAAQFAAQSAHYARHHAEARYAVIVVDGEPAGRLIVARGEQELCIVDIALLPPFRGRGIGTGLLHTLIAESEGSGRKLSIHVEANNPARTLYDRLGFRPTGEDGVYVAMERA